VTAGRLTVLAYGASFATMVRALLIALAGLALLGGSGAAARPAAHAARTCTPPDYPGSGYFTSLSVKRVSCRTGRSVALAYYRCRTRNGPKGRCSERVMRFRCSERRNSIPTEIDARVTCKRGSATVTHTYQQNV
jgi:hypothetical protein